MPIQYGLYRTGLSISKQFEFVILSRKASQQNKALTEQIAVLLSENANLRRKLAETEGFLEQQKALNPKTYNLIPSRPLSQTRYLGIDKGTQDGLSKNQVVVYKDNYIGTIKNISPRQSEVILVSDPDSKIAVFSQGSKGKAKGILLGQFGQEMLLDKILHEEPIEKGDLVYSEGAEASIPRGLVLGQVSEVLERSNEVFKQAKVRPLFSIGDLDILFVITN